MIQLIVELHWIGNDRELINSIEKICEYFYVIHVHGNNFGELRNIDETRFSTISEFTFINKAYVKDKPTLRKGKYPIQGLDYINGGLHEDWSIEF